MKFIKIFGTLALAIAISSCMKGSYQSSYTAYCTFESADTTKEFVNGIFQNSDFWMGDGALRFCGKRNDDGGTFYGGMMAAIRKDFHYEEGYTPKSLYTVADSTGGAGKSVGFGIFFDNQDPSMMPEHEVVFTCSEMGTCTLTGLSVANTNYVANAVMFGHSGIAKFQQGDYFTFKVTAYLGGKEAGTASIDLARYDEKGLNVLTKWAAMDLSKISSFDALDFSFVTNRGDLPHYCCIDNLIASIVIGS